MFKNNKYKGLVISKVKFSGKDYKLGNSGIINIIMLPDGDVKVFYETNIYVILSSDGIEELVMNKQA